MTRLEDILDRLAREREEKVIEKQENEHSEIVREYAERIFFDRVALLRVHQKEYFATRSRDALMASKALENEIDNEIERVTAILAARESPNLFNT